MPESSAPSKSNLGKWNDWYRGLSIDHKAPLYGDEVTYLIAAAFLADLAIVEDWGCGRGGFRRFCVTPTYIGIRSRAAFWRIIVMFIIALLDCDGTAYVV